ncbi:MAG TPA: sigma 54-interacting transcriptional regulator, partial [Polyangiaceae bacterium]|nr:sigma 54-interacting transcriptional regulator [Polyangiaceae bacterium]
RIEVAGDSPEMAEAVATAERAARSMTTLLIRGESGVGKEVLARYVHARSPRAHRPFVKVHCASLPEAILESELFGYEKGAFTGAGARKPGRFELAEGGTIFLDEIGDVSPAVQVKLLRAVQDREYERLGGTDVLRADVRIITATHRNLERMVKNGEFRQDLYYRLNVLRITVPPLRSRPSDVERLALKFCARFASANGRSVRLGREALDALRSAPWPGNVRQLQNVIERLVVLSDAHVVDASDVRRELERDTFAAQDEGTEMSAVELGAAVRKAERRALKRALERSGGNRALAARLLGVSRRTLFYKLREHAIG